jgi:hypothetical protein
MSGEHRSGPHSWLCAGAVTLGVGAALCGAPGFAYAEDGSGSSPAADHSASISAPASGGTPSDDDSPKFAAPQASSSTTAETSEADDTPAADKGAADDADQTSPSQQSDESATDNDATDDEAADDDTEPEAQTESTERSSRAVVSHSVTPTATPTAASVSPVAVTARDLEPEPDVAVSVKSVTPAAAEVQTPAPADVEPALETNPVKALVVNFFYVVNSIICPNPPALPTNPFQLLAYEFFRRIEIQFGLPVVGTATTTISDPVDPVYAPDTPSPGDTAHTVYGDIGKWMLQSDGQISNWCGQQYGGRTLLEPINVLIVDPTSTSVAESTAKLNAELGQAGFPVQLGHSTGFSGVIDGQTYSQQPTGLIDAYADQFFLFPQDHARAFGPDPLETSAGYVWTLAVSREIFGFYGLLPAHLYVSFKAGRDNLASKLVSAGGTLVGFVALGNAYDGVTVETGDSDGYAAVIRLND